MKMGGVATPGGVPCQSHSVADHVREHSPTVVLLQGPGERSPASAGYEAELPSVLVHLLVQNVGVVVQDEAGAGPLDDWRRCFSACSWAMCALSASTVRPRSMLTAT